HLGYLPEALFNFITLLGWSPGGGEEIFDREKLIDIFDPDRLSISPAVFDPKKLQWINKQDIKAPDLETVIEITLTELIEAGRVPETMDDDTRKWAEKLIALYKDQLSDGAAIVELTELLFKTDISYDEEIMDVLRGEQVIEVLQVFTDQLIHLDEFNKDTIKA